MLSRKRSLFVLILLCLASSAGLFFVFSPVSSKADTYYRSINCPTPGQSRPNLQLVPCTPSGVVNQTPPFNPKSAPTPTNKPSNNNNSPVTPPSNQSGEQSGNVCTPDSTIASGAACKCQSDLEPDAVCTVASAQVCAQNGGLNNPLAFAGLGGALDPNLLNKTITTSPNGPVQCMWLDTAPVPAAAHATNCSIECNSKPVLYFYSPTTMNINVSLDIPGFVTASIPTYPANGWQNVIVHPTGTNDGTLVYNGKNYNELYYEDATIKAQSPTQGFVIKTSNLTTSLRTYTTELGLTKDEQNEFLAYWVPRLTSLNAPYIFFTVFDQTQKEKVDHVIVSPTPTTTIAFLAYFKPLSEPKIVAPLQFPAVPRRVGFTMVEWGGTIDNN